MATMIEGVSGLRKSGLCAGGRIRQVSSVTSNTSGQSFSHASQTMHPGAIQTLVTTEYVSAMSGKSRSLRRLANDDDRVYGIGPRTATDQRRGRSHDALTAQRITGFQPVVHVRVHFGAAETTIAPAKGVRTTFARAIA